MTIDLTEIYTIEQFHHEMKQNFQFPASYESNWDALWDNLIGIKDMPEQVILDNWQYFEGRFKNESKKLRVLVEDYNNHFSNKHIEIIRGKGSPTFTCIHLKALEQAMKEEGCEITYTGQAWGENTRFWIYFKCVFTDIEKTINRLQLDTSIIQMHSHQGTHDGSEYGLVCTQCNDAVMGRHPSQANNVNAFV